MCSDATSCLSVAVGFMQALGVYTIFQGVIAAMLIVGLTFFAIHMLKR